MSSDTAGSSVGYSASSPLANAPSPSADGYAASYTPTATPAAATNATPVTELGSTAATGGSKPNPFVPTPRSKGSGLPNGRIYLIVSAIVIILLLLVGVGFWLNKKGSQKKDLGTGASQFPVATISLGELAKTGSLGIDKNNRLVVNGQLQLNGAVVFRAQAPSNNPVAGELFFNSETNRLNYYDGTTFQALLPPGEMVSSIGGLMGDIVLGNGFVVNNGKIDIVNGGVTAFQGQVGNVTLLAGDGISIGGTTISNTGVLKVTGTANQVTASASTGNITLSLPQDIAVTSTPTFAGLTLTGPLGISSGGTGVDSFAANGVVISDNNGNLTTINDNTPGGLCLISNAGPNGEPGWTGCSGAGASVASVDGQTGAVSIANASGSGGVNGTITIDNASLTTKGIAQFNSTNFTASAGLINLAQNIHTGATPIFGGLTITGASTFSGTITANASTGLSVSNDATIGGNLGVGGVLTVSTLGATDNLAFLCRNSSNQLAACATSGNGAAYVQGGNSFGAAGDLGTNDSNGLNLRTNGTTRIAISATGDVVIQGTGGFTSGTGAFNINGNATVGAGKNVTFAAGTGNFDQSASSGTFKTGTGAVTLNGNTTVSGSNTFTSGTGAVSLNGATTVANNQTFTALGSAVFRDATPSSTAFAIQAAGGGTSLLNVSTVGTVNMLTNAAFDNDDSTACSGGPCWSALAASGSLAPTVSWDSDVSHTVGNGTSGSLDIANNTGNSTTFTAGAAYAVALSGGLGGHSYSLTGYLRSDNTGTKTQNIYAGWYTGSDLTSHTDCTGGTGGNKYLAINGAVWLQFQCVLTIPASTTATGIYFRSSSKSSGNNGFHIDDLVLTDDSGNFNPVSNGLVQITDVPVNINGNIDGLLQVSNSLGKIFNVNGSTGTVTVSTKTNGPSFIVNGAASQILELDSGSTADLSGQWKTGSSMPINLAPHQAVVVSDAQGNKYAYVAGGVTTGNAPTNAVYFSPLSANGGNGGWTQVANLPAVIEQGATVTDRGYIYSIGGTSDGSNGLSDIYYNQVDSVTGGLAGAWQNACSPSLSCGAAGFAARLNFKAVVYNHYLYAIGGTSTSGGSYTSPSIQYAKINADGTLGPWQTGTAMTNGGFNTRTRMEVVASNGFIYVIGGVQSGSSSSRSDIIYNSINADGSLGGTWTAASNALPTPNIQSSAVISNINGNLTLYVMGGESTSFAGTVYNTVYSGVIDPNSGDVGALTTSYIMDSSNNLYKRHWAGAFATSSTVYFIGGNKGSSSYANTVLYAPLSATPNTATLGAKLNVSNGEQLSGDLIVKPISTDSTTALQVNNAAGLPVFNVNTVSDNISIGGSSSNPNLNSIPADLHNWATPNKNNLPSGNLGSSCPSAPTTYFGVGSTIVNGHVYVIGGNSSCVLWGEVNADGSIGSLSATVSPFNTLESVSYSKHNMVTSANGYIYVIGGFQSGDNAVAKIFYTRPNTDGTITSWKEASSAVESSFTAVGAAGITVYNNKLYIAGGATTSVASSNGDRPTGTPSALLQYAALNADGTLGTFATSAITGVMGAQAVVANGYMYITGGDTGSGAINTVAYSKLNGSGVPTSWTTSSVGLSRAYHGTMVANGYLYLIGGTDTSYAANSHAMDSIIYGKLNSDGTVTGWTAESSESLYQGIEDFGSVSANGYYYIIGGATGLSGSTVLASGKINYGTTARVSIGGALDLVGLGSKTLSDAGGGGLLTAGDTTIVGTLDVRDSATFTQSVAIDSNLSAHGQVLLQNTTDTTTAFAVQQATGVNVLTVDTSGGQVVLGTPGPTGGLTGALAFKNSTNSNTLIIQSGATGTNLTLTLPVADGNNGDCLKTDSHGVLSFGGCLSGGGSGSGIISLNGLTNSSLSIAGTTDEISVSPAGSTITLSTPQPINTTSNVTFNKVVATDLQAPLIQTADGSAASTAIVLRSGNTTGSGNTGTLTIATGAATSGNSGNISIDSGSASATAGTITLGGTNASALTVGRSGLTVSLPGGLTTAGGAIATAGGLINGQTIAAASTFATSVAVGTSSSTTGSIVFKGSGNSNTITLTIPNTPGNRTITLPDESGTICTTAVVCTGYAAGTNSGAYIQNQSASDQTADFRISGSGRAATSLLSPIIDTPTATALGIGSTNATQINLQQNTVLASGKSLSIQGAVTIRPATDSTTALTFQNAAGATMFNVDSATTPNLLTNPGFELSPITGWAAKGSSTLTRDSTQQYSGFYSGKVVTTATANDGIKQNITLTNSKAYTLSAYVRLDGASNPLSTLVMGYAANGSTETTYVTSAQTPVTGGWTRFTLTFTPTGITGTPYIFIKQTDATIHTFYVDSVQLQTGSSATAYQNGLISLNAVIGSPLSYRNQSDSTTALQIQNASGTTLFNADTLNSKLTIGTVGSATLANLNLYVSTAQITGTTVIGSYVSATCEDSNSGNGYLLVSSANSFEPLLCGSARHTKRIALSPEFPGAVLRGDGSGNTGTMTSSYDATNVHNYYKWTTSLSNQTFDIVVRVPVPSDFSGLTASPQLCGYALSSDLTNGIISTTLKDTSGATVSFTSSTGSGGADRLTPTSLNTWQESCMSFSTGTFAANGVMTWIFHMQAPTAGTTELGEVRFDYLSKF